MTWKVKKIRDMDVIYLYFQIASDKQAYVTHTIV